jgi:hypothetical protein
MKIVKQYKQKVVYKEGDSLKIKPGVRDYLTRCDIGGLEGRIFNVLDEDELDALYEIEIDSISLKQLSKEFIEKSIKKRSIFFYLEVNNSEVETTQPRDNVEDVKKLQNLLLDVYDCHDLVEDHDYTDELDVSKGEEWKDNLTDDTEPDDIHPDECEQCPDKEHCKSFESFKSGAIERFLFTDNNDQLYSLDISCNDLEKMFCPVPVKQWKHQCKEFNKGYALN